MKRLSVLVLVFSLIVNLAVPSGAVFALSGGVVEELEPLVETPVVAHVDEGEDSVDDRDETPLIAAPQEETAVIELAVAAPMVIDEPEPVPVATEPVLPPIVIAQIQVGAPSPSNASDEYVSIFNNGDETVDVTGWCVRNKSSRNIACLNELDVEYMIEPGAYIGFSSVPHRPGAHGLVVPFVAGNNAIVASSDTIQLVHGEVVIDAIHWTSSPSGRYGIEREWDLTAPGRLLTGNDAWSWKTGLAEYGRIYELIECSSGVFVREGESCPESVAINLCHGVVLSEIAAHVDEQFIEVHNANDEVVSLTGCQLQTNRSTKTFVFSEEMVLEPGEYMTVLIAETELTLTKTTVGTVYMLSSDGRTEVESVEYRNLAKETSWSRFDEEWRQTYALTPGVVNAYEQYLPCEAGYWRNEETRRCNKIIEPAVLVDCGEGRERNAETGRCRNIPTEKELAPCKEGQYRSEETNRCRSIASAAASALKPCADDQFRNPETNRCKKIASADELADCGEGRERNPTTNRCRNVLAATTSATPFAPEPVTHAAQGMLGWWAFGGVSLLALGYAGWQWRFEMARFARKVRTAVFSGSKE